MKITEAKKRADKKWEQSQYKILVRIDKSKEERIKEVARDNGETVSEMVKRLIDQEINKNSNK